MSSNLLQDFLSAEWGDPYHVDESLVSHFKDELGVDVKQEGDLFLFKYHQLEAKWDNPIVLGCRGTIMRFHREARLWNYASRPFDKFFNLHEAPCELFDEDAWAYTLLHRNMKVVEKVDGSLIQLWFDWKEARWRASTTGTITSKAIHGSDITFSDLFWRNHPLLQGCPERLEELSAKHPCLLQSHTYLFEIAAYENMVVTDYGRTRLVFLGSRDNSTGQYDAYSCLSSLPFERPQSFHVLDDLSVATKEDLRVWAREEAESSEEVYGRIPEGFVLYDGVTGVPLAKLKLPTYLEAHKLNDPLRWEKGAVESIFLGTYDDIQGALSGLRRERADEHQEQIHTQCQEALTTAHLLAGKKYDTRAGYANQVKAVAPKQYQHFFFQNQEVIEEGEGISEAFSGWLAKNYKRLTRNYLREYASH